MGRGRCMLVRSRRGSWELCLLERMERPVGWVRSLMALQRRWKERMEER